MKVHAPYCHLRSLIVSYFSTQSHKQTLVNIECVFRFSLQLLSETFLILRRNEHDFTINVHRSSCKVPGILVRFEWNLYVLDRFSKKYWTVKFHENLSSGSRVISCGRTERHAANSRFSQFCERAQKWVLCRGPLCVRAYGLLLKLPKLLIN
jgi:hypothetical protein